MNNDYTNPTQEDFQSALAAEFDLPPAEDSTPAAPTPKPEEVEPVTPPADQAQVPPAADATPAVGEPAKPEGDVTTPPVDEAPKFATKDDVAAALREYNQETTGRIENVKQATEQVIEKLYPEGIDRNIYDTNGQVIKTAQDIVDRGLMKDNGEEFTYEEAASFILQAQQKMNQNVEDLNNWAEKVAEDNISLIESNKRVMAKWGDTLKALPQDMVEQLATAYTTKQVKFDKTNSYVTEMSMTPEEFYDTVLAPYSRLAQSIAAKEQQAAITQSQTAASQQADRNGIPPQRGSAVTKSNTGDPMLDALIDEMNKD